MDLTFSNPAIKAYFEGTSNDAPIGELIYIHSHYLDNNFLSELEVLINKASIRLSQPDISNKPSTKAVLIKLVECSEKYALLCNSLNLDPQNTAAAMLPQLRDIYKLCNIILS
jgi:uncharacterized protein YfkK (UPF0435 family)